MRQLLYYIAATLTILGCKKALPSAYSILPIDDGVVKGEILWPNDSTTPFKNHAPDQNTHVAFLLDLKNLPGDTLISIYAESNDTNVTIEIHNLNLQRPGIYDFAQADSAHLIVILLSSGFAQIGVNPGPPPKSFLGASEWSPGTLTVDSISQKRIAGSIDAWCPSRSDTSQVRLTLYFTGDFTVRGN